MVLKLIISFSNFFVFSHFTTQWLDRSVGDGIVKGGGTPMSFVIVFKFPSPTVHKIHMKWDTFWGKIDFIFFCYFFEKTHFTTKWLGRFGWGWNC